MKNFSSWLITMFAFLFWGFRLAGTVMYTLGMDFLFVPSDPKMEIALLFITFICICFFVKRKLWSSIIYLSAHFLYYGPVFITHLSELSNGSVSANSVMGIFFEFVGLVLPLIALFDVLLDKNRKAHPTDKKTDWFYKNAEYDRQMDERADKNNYRTL